MAVTEVSGGMAARGATAARAARAAPVEPVERPELAVVLAPTVE